MWLYTFSGKTHIFIDARVRFKHSFGAKSPPYVQLHNRRSMRISATFLVQHLWFMLVHYDTETVLSIFTRCFDPIRPAKLTKRSLKT